VVTGRSAHLQRLLRRAQHWYRASAQADWFCDFNFMGSAEGIHDDPPANGNTHPGFRLGLGLHADLTGDLENLQTHYRASTSFPGRVTRPVYKGVKAGSAYSILVEALAAATSKCAHHGWLGCPYFSQQLNAEHGSPPPAALRTRLPPQFLTPLITCGAQMPWHPHPFTTLYVRVLCVFLTCLQEAYPEPAPTHVVWKRWCVQDILRRPTH